MNYFVYRLPSCPSLLCVLPSNSLYWDVILCGKVKHAKQGVTTENTEGARATEIMGAVLHKKTISICELSDLNQ